MDKVKGYLEDLEVQEPLENIKKSFAEAEYIHISEEGKVKVFYLADNDIESMEKLSRWTYFKINNHIYNSFYTNDISFWNSEDYEEDFEEVLNECCEIQLSLF